MRVARDYRAVAPASTRDDARAARRTPEERRENTILRDSRGQLILGTMKHSPLSIVVGGALSLVALSCLTSSNSGPAAGADGGSLSVDSGAGCDSLVLVRCAYPNGTCAEFSGPLVGDAGDPFDCAGGGGVLGTGEACPRTGAEGSCVEPSGLTVVSGKTCQFFLTTWIPQGFDSGVAGQTCAGLLGTFVPN
jgi:hypothetical protein